MNRDKFARAATAEESFPTTSSELVSHVHCSITVPVTAILLQVTGITNTGIINIIYSPEPAVEIENIRM